MKILLIQCLRGSSIGEIELEHINNDRYFYYSLKKALESDELEPRGNVFLVEYKCLKDSTNEKQCCAIALGKYKKLKDDNLDSEKDLLKIYDIKQIKLIKNKLFKNKFNIEELDRINYKKISGIINEINSQVLNDDVTHNLMEINIDDYKFVKLDGLLNDNNSRKERKESSEEILASYDKLEKNLCKFAQKSIYAKRVENKGKPRINRTEYQRDWERIVHSKSFRRLEDKAQIYTLAKGDHFRTRLTHTLEVTQIARGISRELDLNEDLVEAIALGHDLGHTPFGHVGERTLNQILKDKGVEGGFKHNFQGVKVVNYLEEKYGEFEGIDLTYQVMEGILKHTKICSCDKKNECNKSNGLECDDNEYKIEKFLCKGDVKRLHPEYSFSTSLEGQAVAVADEIAQRSHDLDDGIASGIVNEKTFLDQLKKDPDFEELRKRIDNSLYYIEEDERKYIDVLDIKRARIVSEVITYFIAKVVKSSKDNIKEYMKKDKVNESNLDELVIDKKIIYFDKKTERVTKKLEDITSNKIINSEEVNCFDGKGAYIIKKLYSAYCTNPRQMPTTTLKRILREICKYTNDVVDITNCERKSVKKEIDIYNGKYLKDTNNVNNEVEKLKHKIFIRCIIDLIAGMTDDFANKQFSKLYLPRIY